MSARDLATRYPFVTTQDSAADAARLLCTHRLPALLVVDADGFPFTVMPATALLGALLPHSVLEDPLLALTIGDRHLDALAEKLVGLTVEEWLPHPRPLPLCVGPEAGALQMATLMSQANSPLVAVIDYEDDRPRVTGAVTADRLLQQLVTGNGGP